MSRHSKTWRVKWVSPTGAAGHGSALFYREDAERWAAAGDNDPDSAGVRHDIEDTEETK